jgi:hypothetical protein
MNSVIYGILKELKIDFSSQKDENDKCGQDSCGGLEHGSEILGSIKEEFFLEVE